MITLMLGLALAADPLTPDTVPFDVSQQPAAAPDPEVLAKKLRAAWRTNRDAVIAGSVVTTAGIVLMSVSATQCEIRQDYACLSLIFSVPLGTLMIIGGVIPLSVGAANVARIQRRAHREGIKLFVVPSVDRPGVTMVGRF